MLEKARLPSSFRDPNGFVFEIEGVIHRCVRSAYKQNYDKLIESGLYESLVSDGLLIPHEERPVSGEADAETYKFICPERIPFISYPYEWSFGQLKDAALCTLEITERALAHDMVLKDATAYNVQFRNSRPVLIDTLSFERYIEGGPWIAYRQFCEQFLAPLALSALRDPRMIIMLQPFIDGVPLDLTVQLLPWHASLNPGLLVHLCLHAKANVAFANKAGSAPKGGMSKLSLLALIDNLKSCVNGLKIKTRASEWSDYYGCNNYDSESMRSKEDIVERFLTRAQAKLVWDLGANTGRFSRLAARLAGNVIAIDGDFLCVEHNYRLCRTEGLNNILPLRVDLCAPSPNVGFNNRERQSLAERGPADVILALALVHHLCITHNVPLQMVAEFLAGIGKSLIIEFVPKSDSQVQGMLSRREDIFSEYTEASFVRQFEQYFEVEAREPVGGSERTLFLMQRRSA